MAYLCIELFYNYDIMYEIEVNLISMNILLLYINMVKY